MRKFIVLLIIILLLVVTVLFFKSNKESNGGLSKEDSAFIKANLVQIRINLVELIKINPLSKEFNNRKELLINQIKESNTKLSSVNFSTTKDYSDKLFILIEEYNQLSGVLAPVYNIYLPSNYEEFKVDFNAYYQGEVKDKGIFSNLKYEISNLDRAKYNTDELLKRINEMDVLFKGCLEKVGGEVVDITDFEECEDAINLGELKELAYDIEKALLTSEPFLQFLTDITNLIYKLDPEL